MTDETALEVAGLKAEIRMLRADKSALLDKVCDVHRGQGQLEGALRSLNNDMVQNAEYTERELQRLDTIMRGQSGTNGVAGDVRDLKRDSKAAAWALRTAAAALIVAVTSAIAGGWFHAGRQIHAQGVHAQEEAPVAPRVPSGQVSR